MLEIDGLTVNYGLRRALNSVSLQVSAGEVVALLGPNGAGKTTLLRAVSGLLPVISGRVRLGGQDISRLRPDLRVRQGLVHVPEGGGIFAPLTVLENLILAAKRDGLRRQPALDEVYRLFPILRERSHQRAGSLSGGERQMLALARGLLAQPQVLMLDEPSLGLAPLVMGEIFAVLDRLRAAGMTVLVVEQNVRMALRLARRVYVLDQGEIRAEGQAADIATSPVWNEVFLGQFASPNSGAAPEITGLNGKRAAAGVDQTPEGRGRSPGMG